MNFTNAKRLLCAMPVYYIPNLHVGKPLMIAGSNDIPIVGTSIESLCEQIIDQTSMVPEMINLLPGTTLAHLSQERFYLEVDGCNYVIRDFGVAEYRKLVAAEMAKY